MTTTFQTSDVADILALMERWGIAEVHLAVGEATLDIVRTVATPATTVEAPAPLAPPAADAAAPPPPVTITAPVVGVFHLATRGFPHGAPQPGDRVQEGQIIGSIELMRVPTDLVATATGIIEAVMAEDGASVEYGQPLMVIHPSSEVSEDASGTSTAR